MLLPDHPHLLLLYRIHDLRVSQRIKKWEWIDIALELGTELDSPVIHLWTWNDNKKNFELWPYTEFGNKQIFFVPPEHK